MNSQFLKTFKDDWEPNIIFFNNWKRHKYNTSMLKFECLGYYNRLLKTYKMFTKQDFCSLDTLCWNIFYKIFIYQAVKKMSTFWKAQWSLLRGVMV